MLLFPLAIFYLFRVAEALSEENGIPLSFLCGGIWTIGISVTLRHTGKFARNNGGFPEWNLVACCINGVVVLPMIFLFALYLNAQEDDGLLSSSDEAWDTSSLSDHLMRLWGVILGGQFFSDLVLLRKTIPNIFVLHHVVSTIFLLVATNVYRGGRALMIGGFIVELGSTTFNVNGFFNSSFTNVLYLVVMPISNLIGLYVVYGLEMTPFYMQCFVKLAGVVLLLKRTEYWISVCGAGK